MLKTLCLFLAEETGLSWSKGTLENDILHCYFFPKLSNRQLLAAIKLSSIFFSKHNYYIVINMLRAFSVICMIALTTQSIFLTLKPKTPRCMVEYTAGSGASTTMKIKIIFPKIQDHISHEHFYVTLRNTENDELESQVVSSGGKYIKEA